MNNSSKKKDNDGDNIVDIAKLIDDTTDVRDVLIKDDKYSYIYVSLLEMLDSEDSIRCMDDDEKQYRGDCANPIVIYLYKSALKNLRFAVTRCRAAFMILAEYKAMNLLSSLDNKNNDKEHISLSSIPQKDICQRQRQRVTDMMNIAQVDREVEVTSTNIQQFYATLAPGSTPTHHRRKPKWLIEEDN